MEGRIRDFLHYCKTMDFGKRELSRSESLFYRRFSDEIVSLCQSLPKSIQTVATLFLMRYSGVSLSDHLDFFSNFYSPIWSIIYWLTHDPSLPIEQFKKSDIENAVRAQSMAMFLHSLDDHLSDSQIAVTPLTLLLRSEAWSTMNRACSNLALGTQKGETTIRRFINDYYSSTQDSRLPKSINSYCRLFRRQMAIVMISPVLLSMKLTGISDFTRDIKTAFGSFGIAWRLLDDINDIAEDIENGSHTAIYLCASKKIQAQWNNDTGKCDSTSIDPVNVILEHIRERRLTDKVKERICAELESAAALVQAHRMTGLAREFRCLAQPLRNG